MLILQVNNMKRKTRMKQSKLDATGVGEREIQKFKLTPAQEIFQEILNPGQKYDRNVSNLLL